MLALRDLILIAFLQEQSAEHLLKTGIDLVGL
jgi:hypothetical protein